MTTEHFLPLDQFTVFIDLLEMHRSTLYASRYVSGAGDELMRNHLPSASLTHDLWMFKTITKMVIKILSYD